MHIDRPKLTRPAASDAKGSDLPQLARFALLRVATMPFAAMDKLRLPRTSERLDRIAAAEARMEALRETLADALHALVPGLEQDDALRRTVINLRRHIHNGRTNRPSPATLEAIAGLLSAGDRAALDDWLAAQAALAKARDGIEALLSDEIRTVLRPALRAPLATPHFSRAVALANPRTLREALREKKLPRTPWPDRLERSLLGYLARASVKTSPFSSFMANAIVPVDVDERGTTPWAGDAAFTSIATLNRGLVSELADTSFAAAAQAGDLQLTVNATLRPTGSGRQVGLCGRQVSLNGRPWYEQRWAQFRLTGELEQALTPGLSLGWGDWVARLAAVGLTRDKAAEALPRLIERGVLVPEPLADGFTTRPGDCLVQRWQDSGNQRLAAAAPALQQMDAIAANFASVPAADRIATLGRLDALCARTVAEAGLAEAGLGAAAASLQNIVTEDCWLDGIEGRLGSDLLAPLVDLNDFLRGQMAISPVYGRLVQAFVDIYGPGGRCDDVVSFLLTVVGKLIDLPEFGARTEEHFPDPAPEGAQVPITAHVQIARSGQTPDRLIVNRIYDGAGWLASRFTLGSLPQQQRLAAALRDWSKSIAGTAEPVDLPISGHCSDLQAHALLTDRVLAWPGEPLTRHPDQILHAADLRLDHDPATGFLRLSDRHRGMIDLQYFGNTLPTATWGVRYALSVLTRPFTLARPALAPSGLDQRGPVFRRPGRTHGAVVLRRDGWWVRSDHLRDVWLSGTPAEQLVAARRDCDRHGIPHRFFAQQHVAQQRSALVTDNMMDANRKPLWIDIANPFWLAMLGRIAAKSDWMVLTAPDPGPEDMWLTLGGERHAAELHLEMLITAGARRARNSSAS